MIDRKEMAKRKRDIQLVKWASMIFFAECITEYGPALRNDLVMRRDRMMNDICQRYIIAITEERNPRLSKGGITIR